MDVEWDDSAEQLLEMYADESACREIMHRESYYYYRKCLINFALPVVVLSVISGSGQFISKSYPVYENLLVSCTGCLSIITAILSSVQSYLKLGEKANKHEMAEVAWQTLHNTIKHTLGLARPLREDAAVFVSRIRDEHTRLFEVSPILDQKFITKLKTRLKKTVHKGIRIPNYLNGMTPCKAYNEFDGCEENSVI